MGKRYCLVDWQDDEVEDEDFAHADRPVQDEIYRLFEKEKGISAQELGKRKKRLYIMAYDSKTKLPCTIPVDRIKAVCRDGRVERETLLTDVDGDTFICRATPFRPGLTYDTDEYYNVKISMAFLVR